GEALAAIEASNYDLASDIARAELDRGAVHPLLLNLRAYWHEKQGRVGAALADLEHAHALAPRDVPVLNALGLCLEKIGRTREAFDAFDAAAKHAPDLAAVHINRGRLAEALGQSDTARASYERALQLGHNAHANLAALAARRADWPAARRHGERALAIDPGLTPAEHALASAETADGDYATAEGRLSRLLDNSSLGPQDRAQTLCLLGDALDGAGRTDAAFAAYQAGNSQLRQINAPRFANPAVENMRQYVERLSRYFEQFPRERWADADADAAGNEDGPANHVFLLGFARSGTTLIEEALASSPDVVTTQEKDGLADSVSTLLANEAALDRLAALRGGGLVRYRRSYWRRLAEFGIAPRGKCLVDKQPWNTIGLPLVAKLFPAAKIVFCLRDPRDVVLSCFRRRFLMNATNYQLLSLEDTARFYDSVMRLADIYRAKLPLDLCEARHEILIANFDEESRKICEFIGMPWLDRMRDFAERAPKRAIVTPSGGQIARGLNSEGVGYWRRYRTQIEPILPILQPWVERFGYAAE
ncbi:MAG TPA: sulfotransferase, partial [Rhizomicrobium sp.]